MPVGRKPKPTHLHVIEGTSNTTRHRGRKREPKPTGELQDAPDWFTDAQRDVWSYGLRSAPRGLLKAIDLSVFTVWVVACDAHRQAAEQLAKLGPGGLLTRTATRHGRPDANGNPTTVGGSVVQSPLVGIMNRQALIMIKAAAEMGFTPSSRARVVTDPHAPLGNDPESEFFGD